MGTRETKCVSSCDAEVVVAGGGSNGREGGEGTV